MTHREKQLLELAKNEKRAIEERRFALRKAANARQAIKDTRAALNKLYGPPARA